MRHLKKMPRSASRCLSPTSKGASSRLLALFKRSEPGSLLVLAASLIYIVGSFLVTVVFNMPLNDALAAATPASSEGAALRARYLKEWTW